MQRFATEITELRELGFAEGLRMEALDRERGIVARLESGRVGVAVEFRAREGGPTYAVIPLLADVGCASSVVTELWSDIVRDIRRRAPLTEDE